MQIRPLEGQAAGVGAASTRLGPLVDAGPEEDAEGRCRANLDALRLEMLGFDVDPSLSRELVAEYGRVSAMLAPDHGTLLAGEDEVLTVFVDACSLDRNRPDPDALEGDSEPVRSHHEDLLIYLRSVVGKGEGLPASFLDDLRRALRHYGIEDLEPHTRAAGCALLARQGPAARRPATAGDPVHPRPPPRAA